MVNVLLDTGGKADIMSSDDSTKNNSPLSDGLLKSNPTWPINFERFASSAFWFSVANGLESALGKYRCP